MLVSLALPVLTLMAAAVVVTRLLERAVPESVMGLGLLAALAGGVLWALSAAGAAALYASGAVPLSVLAEPRGLSHLAGQGAKAALIWGPLVALTVVTAPRRWRHATW